MCKHLSAALKLLILIQVAFASTLAFAICIATLYKAKYNINPILVLIILLFAALSASFFCFVKEKGYFATERRNGEIVTVSYEYPRGNTPVKIIRPRIFAASVSIITTIFYVFTSANSLI
jgi:hypothetical protein